MIYFKPSEFVMNNKIVFDKMDKEFLSKLDILREELGLPIIITSSFRDEEYNKKIGGAKSSMHLLGRGADIDITRYTGKQRWLLIEIAKDLGLTVGIKRTIIHLDDRKDQTLFGY